MMGVTGVWEAYYYMDDVSHGDLTDLGVNGRRKLFSDLYTNF